MVRVMAGRIFAVIPFKDKDRCKDIAGYKWNLRNTKMWSWPIGTRARVGQIFPHLREEIDKEIERYHEGNKQIIEAKKRSFDLLTVDKAMFKRPPYDHQVRMIKEMLIDRRFALLCEMGTGKSQAIVNAFEILYKQGQIKHCLIICPKTVMENWAEEIEINSNYRAVIIEGTKKQKMDLLYTNNHFYIINYDVIAGQEYKNKEVETFKLSDFKDLDKFEMVGLDESSIIKNHEAKRTIDILELFRTVKHKYIASGSPVTQSPEDIWAQFNFLDPSYFDYMNFYEFRDRYCVLEEGENRKTGKKYMTIKKGLDGKNLYKNMEELKRKIAIHSIQLKKEDCRDLPEKIYTRRMLDMPGELRKLYDDMINSGYVKTSQGELEADNVLTMVTRLQQIISGAYLESQRHNSKLMELDEIIKENLFNGDQIIIWFKFRKTLALIRQLIVHRGIPYSELHGETDDRQDQIKRFQSGKTKIFLGQIKSGGMGINLTAGNIVVYFENTFSLQDRVQSEARAHRIGQEKKVIYIDLVYRASIDTNIFQAIKGKQDIAKYLVKSFKPGKYNQGE